MTLPRRIPKQPKRASRWRSTAHENHVKGHECSMCGSRENIEFAHYRLGSGAGMGQKPDDWRATSLCAACHRRQHDIGEPAFWFGKDIWAIINFFCRTSPRAAEIRAVRAARAQSE